MKNSSVYVICFALALVMLIVPVCVSAQQTTGDNMTSDPVTQSVPASIRIRSDAPLPDPSETPVMVPMPGMGPLSGYDSMPMGMMGGTTGPGSAAYNGYMSGMGMGCPMMSMMGDMSMAGGAMGYGVPDYYNYSSGLSGNWNYSAGSSYPWMGGGMMGYGGYPAGAYGYNSTLQIPGSDMTGYGSYMPGGGCGMGSSGMPGYGMMGYGYNSSGYSGWQYGPMMGQYSFGGMTGGFDGGYLTFYGILYGILVPLLLIAWIIVGVMAAVYLMRKMPSSSQR